MSEKIVRDERGNILSYRNTNGFGYDRTYDDNCRILTHRGDGAVWDLITYDDHFSAASYKPTPPTHP